MHLVKTPPAPRPRPRPATPAPPDCPACAKDGRHVAGTPVGTAGVHGQLYCCAGDDGCGRLFPEPPADGRWWWTFVYRLTGKRDRQIARLRGETCREAAHELRRRVPNAHVLEAAWLNHAFERTDLAETPPAP